MALFDGQDSAFSSLPSPRFPGPKIDLTSANKTWTLLVVITTGLFMLLWRLLERPNLPANAPPLWQRDDWPLVGALRFFTARADMVLEAVDAHSRHGSGNFSFYLGKKHVVGIGPSAEARKMFFDNKDMSLFQGTAELLTSMPLARDDVDRFGNFLKRSMTMIMHRDHMARNLPLLTRDARIMCDGLLANTQGHGREDRQWRTTDPFDTFYRLIYQMTIRTLGAHEVADDKVLGDYTLSVFHDLERRASTAKVYFPWLPTSGHILRMWDGFRLYRVFSRIVNERKQTGTRHDDSLQLLMDSGASIKDILMFIITALFGGQVSTGINAAFLPIFLTQAPEWKARVTAEVDNIIHKHRISSDQTEADILGTLPLEVWQRDFPLIEQSLRECLRLTLAGTLVRKNTTGTAVPLRADGGEVIPDGSWAGFQVDLVHFDSEIYPSPEAFDPGRYDPGRAEDKKVPYGYVGWGAGRHPCPGMMFAKLEITIVMAYLFALFDFGLASDAQGTPTTSCPRTDRNDHSAKKPREQVYLRYRPRLKE